MKWRLNKINLAANICHDDNAVNAIRQ